MIARLQGELIEYNDEACVLMCAGVGYELHCSLSSLADLQDKKGEIVTLYVHTHVREDALLLFGFSSAIEKTMFLSLLKVNGIGPKSAVNILSGASVNQILAMIEGEDVKALSKLPKVGKKTAEQMILSLKGKLVLAENAVVGKAGGKPPMSTVETQVSSALVNLGFRPQDVDKVIAKIDFAMNGLSVEEGIRQGLAALTHA